MGIVSENLLNITVDIQSYSTSKNSYGEPVQTYSTKASSVKCGVNGSDSLIELYARLGLRSGLRFYFNTDQSLAISDRIVYDSNNYEIKRIHNVNEKDQLWQVDTERIDK